MRLEDLGAHREHQRQAAVVDRRRRQMELALIQGADRFTVFARCWVCGRTAAFAVDHTYAYPVDGVVTPNWREHLRCPGCELNNRMRATLHFFEERLAPSRDAAIYLTEQTTPLYRRLAERHRGIVGSEYLGAAIPLGGCNASGIRNESITRLTFAEESFDHVISLDVLEHVPDYRRALTECRRVLRKGGSLLLSVPFLADEQSNLVRAVVEETGQVRHLLPPEYHGDPLRREGCLAFYQFGWQLLDEVRASGFSEVAAYAFWSRDFGYLGPGLMLFLATASGELAGQRLGRRVEVDAAPGSQGETMTKLDDLLAYPPKLHTDEHGQPISWGISEDVLRFLYREVGPSARTLETGGGLSTVVFALRGSLHTSIIPYADEVERIRDYCLSRGIAIDKLVFHVGHSENLLPSLALFELDLLLIDGCHGFPAPFIDWYYGTRALKVGGWLIVDDTQLWTGRVLRDFLAAEAGWSFEGELSGKTAIFRKREHRDFLSEWAQQPYLVRQSMG